MIQALEKIFAVTNTSTYYLCSSTNSSSYCLGGTSIGSKIRGLYCVPRLHPAHAKIGTQPHNSAKEKYFFDDLLKLSFLRYFSRPRFGQPPGLE